MMEDFKVQVNVSDVPMIKLLKALTRGGFALQADATGQLTIVEVKPVAVDPSLTAIALRYAPPRRTSLELDQLLTGAVQGCVTDELRFGGSSVDMGR